MKFKFKIQEYQTAAVNAITDVFKGQPKRDFYKYTIDKGAKNTIQQMGIKEINGSYGYNDDDIDIGYANPKIELLPNQLLENINSVQSEHKLSLSNELINEFGAVDIDIEMETGTGKTYVYIKSMFELNKLYGFSKFIVVVPSIAIREGVKKSFDITQDHFMELYGKKARYFIYNSNRLGEIENFSSSSDIQVMIINIQAFNARGKDARRIYEEIDEFQSRKPIDVIAKNRPIIILDEPQKMSGDATRESLQKFNPLFSMNFSATHRIKHNLVYALDALDAFEKKLVKKIKVKGFTIKNLRGTNGYMYLQDILLSSDKEPIVKMEIEVAYKSGTKREVVTLKKGDNLYQRSKEMEQYRDNFVINEINADENAVIFLNGNILKLGNASGDVSENDIRRIQIRETIKSHFEKEAELFDKNIKVLSLFFIDEVAKYRQYDENGNEINGIYGKIFEEEYNRILDEYIKILDTPYIRYLQSTRAENVHKGYFSIDKKGRKINSSVSRANDGISDDVSAYDLILKDKERLLSFEEPTRFIFSHSALREGWDNPNVFQICALKHSDNNIQRRQEVGRGLRLCVNSAGERMDSTIPNFDVHSLNVLTVVACDSYEDFVRGLQTEISKNLFDKPIKANSEYFIDKVIEVNGEKHNITSEEAVLIYRYMIKNDYLDTDDKPNEKYKNDAKNNALTEMPPEIVSMSENIHKLIQNTYRADMIDNMIENGNQAKIQDNKLNENFNKQEFKDLWNEINHKYVYKVDFDSEELIRNSVKSINEKLMVAPLTYTVSEGEQKAAVGAEQLRDGNGFQTVSTQTHQLRAAASETIKYDLLGKVAKNTSLTRKTIATILKGITSDKFYLYKDNPEEFIKKVSELIMDQKATIIVDHITYNRTEDKFDSDIFAESKITSEFKNAFKAKRHIKDYVFVDGISKDHPEERQFVEELDNADEVCVYAKLPKGPNGFYIPTPVGNYSPDWAIAFNEGRVKHIYFIAETKGSLESLNLRGIETAKTECAAKLFNKFADGKVRYGVVKSYTDLLNIISGID